MSFSTASSLPLYQALSSCLGQAAGPLSAPALRALLSQLGLTLATAPSPASEVVEIRLLLTRTREFGLVLGAGAGGRDAALEESCLSGGRGSVFALPELASAAQLLDRFRSTLAYQKLAATAQRQKAAPPDAALLSHFEKLLALAQAGAASTVVLQHFELDLSASAAGLTLQGARCEMAAAAPTRLPRPIGKIDQLLHPKRIGVIGVSSTNMNFGRIILHNLMGSGYAKEQLVIIRPGESEIDGVQCVESLQALDRKLDLLIVAVAASAVYALVDEIIATDAVQAVMLIPGGLGETQTSKEAAAAMAQRINAAHAKPGGGPIFLGANCLGVVSHPGHYDSWFIPLERLPKPQKKPQRNSVLLSQSGAFMITRLSQNPWLDPLYMLAIGNQTDLTHGDLLSYFAVLPEIETIGIYVEGFKDLDGLDFARAVRQAVRSGKQVVVYKSGKIPSAEQGVLGHTASIAGDEKIFNSVLRQTGAMVAEDFTSFDDLLYVAGALHHKRIGGKRLGGISGAGFEAVGIADASACDGFAMQVPALQDGTVKKLEAILAAKKLNTLVEIRNPIDINPGADDEAHLQIVEAFLQDSGIDAVVVGMDPTAPAIRSLESSTLRPGFDISDPKSSVHLMPPLVKRNDKPVVAIIDGGTLYDAMAAKLMDQGVCVLRNCARGTKALARYVEARLVAQSL